MKKILAFALAFFCLTSIMAQDSSSDNAEPKLNISGYVDAYYKYNFNKNVSDNKTSFTNSQNSFELGMASVKFQELYKKAEFVADLGFGQRAKEFSYNDDGIAQAIKQLYVDYAFTDHFKLTLGSFATHMGWELVDPTGNTNYSMSYAFSYGPFFHTGLKADFTFGKWTAMVGVFDPSDHKSNFFSADHSGSYNNRKNIGAQLTYAPSSKVKVFMNYLEGKDTFNISNNQLNPIVTFQATDKFGIVYCGYWDLFKTPDVTGIQQWVSNALYFNYNFTSAFGLSYRTEYFMDRDNMAVFTNADMFPGGGNIFSNTLSANIHLGKLTVIPELRIDNASKALFNKSNGDPAKSTVSALFAAYYSF